MFWCCVLIYNMLLKLSEQDTFSFHLPCVQTQDSSSGFRVVRILAETGALTLEMTRLCSQKNLRDNFIEAQTSTTLWTVAEFRNYETGSGLMECLMDFNELPHDILHQQRYCWDENAAHVKTTAHWLYVFEEWAQNMLSPVCVCSWDCSSAVDVDVVPPIDRSIYYISLFGRCERRW